MSIKVRRSFLLLLAGLLSLLICGNATANHESERYRDRGHQSLLPLSVYLGGGYGFGGNEVGRFVDNNGDIEKIRGGGGLLLEGGLLLSVDPSTALRLTAGYQADGVSRLNGDSSFERMRFDLTFVRAFGPHELGAGITAHTSVGYQCNISSVCSGDVDFDSAVGYTVEYAINVSNGYYGRGRYNKRRGGFGRNLSGIRLGLRYTGVEYTPRLADSDRSDIVDGTTLSAFVGVSF